MNDAQSLDFMVRKDDLREVRFAKPDTRAGQTLEPGEALLRIDRYAFTANNITYALVGQAMRYWDFFPAPEGWGRVPVWGYAEVAASRASALLEGARFFGCLPMSAELRVRPEHVTDSGFVDATAHRRALPAAYQRLARVQTGDPASEDIGAVLKPLAGTGFLIADWLNDQAFFGARQVLVTSASSKTALATAFHASRWPERGCEVIGLTSPRHRAFCERTGYYDRVLEYARLDELPASVPTTLVDMAGDPEVLQWVHTHFGAASLRYSCLVGLTQRTPYSVARPDPSTVFLHRATSIAVGRLWVPKCFWSAWPELSKHSSRLRATGSKSSADAVRPRSKRLIARCSTASPRPNEDTFCRCEARGA
jgi:hypothetical protein